MSGTTTVPANVPLLYAEIIARIRDRAPTFERRVFGTAEFEVASNDEADIILPQAWVVPVEEFGEAPENMGSSQQVRERFGVVVAVSNSMQREDGLGLFAMDGLRALRQQLFNSLLRRVNMDDPERDWMLPSHYVGCVFIGGKHLKMHRARLFHLYIFEVQYRVAPEDVPDTCVPMREMYVRIGVDPFERPPGYENFEKVWDIVTGDPAGVDLPYPTSEGVAPPSRDAGRK